MWAWTLTAAAAVFGTVGAAVLGTVGAAVCVVVDAAVRTAEREATDTVGSLVPALPASGAVESALQPASAVAAANAATANGQRAVVLRPGAVDGVS